MILNVSLDLDGTIVDFYQHYIKKFGNPKSDLEITKNVRGILREDKEFWMTQPLINMPNFMPHCYCTSRLISKNWIKEQLAVNNLPKAPIYQVFGVSLSKYSQLKRSGADVHVDDSLQVFKDLNLKGIPCLLLDSPNNKDWGPIGRVYTLDKEEIEDVYHLFKNTLFPYFKKLC
jgi:hypothetical protein